MQQEVYPKDQNVNLPIQEPYEFNYKDPYRASHHSALSFDQLSPTIQNMVKKETVSLLSLILNKRIQSLQNQWYKERIRF